VRVPQDIPLAIEAPADPDRADERWMPALAPATFLAGQPHCEGVRIELPPAPAPDTSGFVTPPGVTPPPPAHALEGKFGEQVRLLGYDVTGDRVARGGQIDVTLHFRALAPLDGVRLFSHLVGPGGFTNLDHVAAGGAHPVARWRAGETIRDRFSIAIPPALAPGAYTLLVGFWRPVGNRRLTVTPADHADGDGRFRVLTLTVD
jgi:hypothetical protein